MSRPEAWLRGPEAGVIAELQPVAHTLTGVSEEVHSVLAELGPDELWTPVAGGWSVGQHVIHLAGSTQRLLAYAGGRALTDAQLAAARAERDVTVPRPTARALLDALDAAFAEVRSALESTVPDELLAARSVGRAQLPSSVHGLLFHIAEHAQRHAGQIAVIARVVRAVPST